MIQKVARTVIRWGIKCLPKTYRVKLARKLVRFPQVVPSELEIRPAQNNMEIEKALELVYQNYLKMGYSKIESAGIRFTSHHLLPTTRVLVATWKGQIVGTLSVILDYPIALPLEKEFDLSHLRSDGERICEVGALAIDPNFRISNGAIMHLLARYVILFARDHLKADILTIAVNPDMSELYESIYLFEPLNNKNKKDKYDFANGHPAVGLSLNLKQWEEKSFDIYRAAQSDQNFFKFITQPKSCDRFPETNSIFLGGISLGHSEVVHFAKVRTQLLSKLSEQESKSIARCYGRECMEDFIKEGPSSRKRMAVSTTAILSADQDSVFAKVNNISLGGLEVKAKGVQSKVGDKIKITLIGENKLPANLIAEVRWIDNKNRLGLKVLTSSNGWQSLFVAHEKLGNLKLSA